MTVSSPVALPRRTPRSRKSLNIPVVRQSLDCCCHRDRDPRPNKRWWGQFLDRTGRADWQPLRAIRAKPASSCKGFRSLCNDTILLPIHGSFKEGLETTDWASMVVAVYWALIDVDLQGTKYLGQKKKKQKNLLCIIIITIIILFSANE